MNLGGFSAAYPGYMVAEKQATDTDIDKGKLEDLQTTLQGRKAFGNALQMMFGQQMPQQPQMRPSGPPGGMPQPPIPGQPSIPMQQGGGMPQGAPQPQGGPPGGGMPPQQPPMQPRPQGPGGQQQGALDWRIVVAAVTKANPGAPPQVLAVAVDQFMPMMNQQSQQQWREYSLQLREQLATQAESGRNRRADTTADIRREGEEGRNRRADQSEEGRETRSTRSDERIRTRSDQLAEEKKREFDTREQRLREGLENRIEQFSQRTKDKAADREYRIDRDKARSDLDEWKALNADRRRAITQQIQADATITSASEKKRLIDKADADWQATEERITDLRRRMDERRGGGETEPDKPKLEGKTQPIPPAMAKLLKKGEVQEFNTPSGKQSWTLGEDGLPKRVK